MGAIKLQNQENSNLQNRVEINEDYKKRNIQNSIQYQTKPQIEDSQRLGDSIGILGEQNKNNDEDEKIEEDLGNTSSKIREETVHIRLLDIIKRLKLRAAAQKLINSTRSRMLKRMTNYQYAFINDKVQDFSDLKKGSSTNSRIQKRFIINKGIQIFIKVIKLIPVINPSSGWKFLWDIFIAAILLYSFFIIPIMVSFGIEEETISQKNFIEVFLLLNIIDVFIQCNTGFYKHGVICKNRQIIWNKYQNEQLKIDVWSLLPLLFYRILKQSSQTKIEFQFYQFFTLLILIKWKTVSHILQPNIRNILSLLNLFFKILFIAHACACIWIFTAKVSEYAYQDSWINYKKLEGTSWDRQYLSAFYFCTVTMATVGYGDIVPQTPAEIIICIGMVLFACGVFGFSVNTINGILEDFFRNEKEIMEKMFVIKNYLQKKSINQSLSRDVTEYLEYLWRQNQISNPEIEEKMIKTLPESLRSDLLEESNKIVLKECPILKNNFSDDVIKATIQIIKERNYTPDEIIYSDSDENPEKSIYFIQEGIVEQYIETRIQRNTNSYEININNVKREKNQKTIKKLKKGDYFGEIEFFTGENRQKNIRSVSFTTILQIERSDFLRVIKQFPQDYEQFCLIKDRIIFNNDYSKISHKCLSCRSEGHILKHCPYLHFIPNIPKIIAISNRTKIQRRNIIPLEEQAFRWRYRYNVAPKQQLQCMQLFWEINEYLIEEYEQKYLSFSISKCDVCTNFQEADSQHQLQISLQQNANQKEYMVSNFCSSLGNSQTNQMNQNTLVYGNQMNNSQRNNTKNYSQQAIQANTNQPQLQEDQIYTKLKSQIKSQNKKIEAPELQQETLLESFSPILAIKLQPVSLQRRITFKKNELENFSVGYNQSQMNIQQGNQYPSSINIGSQNLIQNNVMPNTDQDELNITNHRQNSLNNMMMNQSNQMMQNESLRKMYKNTSYLQAFDEQNIFKQNLIQQKQHSQIIYFDLFFGKFEKMRNFHLYYPLNNFEFVIKQIDMNTEQKKKMKAKIRQKLTRITQKKKNKNNRGTQYTQSSLIANRKKIKLSENDLKSVKGSNTNNFNLASINNLNTNTQFFPQISPEQNKQKIFSQAQKSRKNTKQSFDLMDDQEKYSITGLKSFTQKIGKSIINDSAVNISEQQNTSELQNVLYANSCLTSIKNNDQTKNFDQGFKDINNKIEQKQIQKKNTLFLSTHNYKEEKDEDITNDSPLKKETNIMSYYHSEKPSINLFFYNSQLEKLTLE